MALSMFTNSVSPIAIDLGASSVKLLQLSTGGERPEIVAAAEMTIPDAMRGNATALFEHYAEQLPKLITKGKFRGKRAVIAIPSAQTFTQHMQLPKAEGMSREEQIKAQLQMTMGASPDGVVVRSIEVGEVGKHGQSRSEVICFAISKRTVMQCIELLKRMRLEVVGVHTETIAMVHAFGHLNRRESDKDVTTLYVDLGWGGTRAAIAHGPKVAFARHIQVAGKHFDQMLMRDLHCQPAEARAYRLALSGPIAKASGTPAGGKDGGMALLSAAAEAQAAAEDSSGERGGLFRKKRGGAAVAEDRRVGEAPPDYAESLLPGGSAAEAVAAGRVDMTELLDTMADELSMGLRYHHAMFPDRRIDRVIFVGGESRQLWLCHHVIRKLRLPAHVGDPLARLGREHAKTKGELDLSAPQPGWAVPCGLCLAPTDI